MKARLRRRARVRSVRNGNKNPSHVSETGARERGTRGGVRELLSSLPLVYGDATTQHEGGRGKQKENRDKDLRTVRFRSGQVGGDWLVKSRKDTRTDADEQRERKVGPQLPPL